MPFLTLLSHLGNCIVNTLSPHQVLLCKLKMLFVYSKSI